MTQRYSVSMSARSKPHYPTDLADLDTATAEVERLRVLLAAAEEDARKQVAKTLKSCIAEGRNRTEVQRHSPFSPPVVRAIGDAAGIPPDPRYVRGKQGAAAE